MTTTIDPINDNFQLVQNFYTRKDYFFILNLLLLKMFFEIILNVDELHTKRKK